MRNGCFEGHGWNQRPLASANGLEDVGFYLTVTAHRLVLPKHSTDHGPVFPRVEYFDHGSDERFVAAISVATELEVGIPLCSHFSGRYGTGHLLQCERILVFPILIQAR